MLYPKVVGQSGTASAEPVLVTNPPTKSSGKVASVVSRAKRCSQLYGRWTSLNETPSPQQPVADLEVGSPLGPPGRYTRRGHDTQWEWPRSCRVVAASARPTRGYWPARGSVQPACRRTGSRRN